MFLLEKSIRLLSPLQLLEAFLLSDQLFLHLALVAVPGLQKLLGFLVGDVGQFLRALLLEHQPFDAVLERPLLVLAVSLHIPGLEHSNSVSDDLAAHAEAVIDDAQTASGVTHSYVVTVL